MRPGTRRRIRNPHGGGLNLWTKLAHKPPAKSYIERYLKAEILQLNCWQSMLRISRTDPPEVSTNPGEMAGGGKIGRQTNRWKWTPREKVFCIAWEDAECLDIQLSAWRKSFFVVRKKNGRDNNNTYGVERYD